MTRYQFQVDGRPAAPVRNNWKDAAHDAINSGMAVWVTYEDSIKLMDNLGATIERFYNDN